MLNLGRHFDEKHYIEVPSYIFTNIFAKEKVITLDWVSWTTPWPGDHWWGPAALSASAYDTLESTQHTDLYVIMRKQTVSVEPSIKETKQKEQSPAVFKKGQYYERKRKAEDIYQIKGDLRD